MDRPLDRPLERPLDRPLEGSFGYKTNCRGLVYYYSLANIYIYYTYYYPSLRIDRLARSLIYPIYGEVAKNRTTLIVDSVGSMMTYNRLPRAPRHAKAR